MKKFVIPLLGVLLLGVGFVAGLLINNEKCPYEQEEKKEEVQEKVIVKKIPWPVEKVVYKDKVVEKPVEKIVYQDRVKIVEVPKIVYKEKKVYEQCEEYIYDDDHDHPHYHKADW